MVVEDDFILAMDLEAILEDQGAEIRACCRTLDDALQILANGDVTIDVAILDVRIGPNPITPVAENLARRDIPFLFYTGQLPTDPVLADWSTYPIISKPTSPHLIVAAIAKLLH